MLGAYNPNLPVLDTIAQEILKLEKVMKYHYYDTDDYVKAIYDWQVNNAQRMVDMFIDDFNSKNPRRGPAPHVPVTVKIDRTDLSFGGYNTEKSIIILNAFPYRLKKEKLFDNIMYGPDGGYPPAKSMDLIARAGATSIVTTTMHEALHAIQMYHKDYGQLVRDFPQSLTDKEVFQHVFFPYELSGVEAAAWAINTSLMMAAIVEPIEYATHDLKSISRYIRKKKMSGVFRFSGLTNTVITGTKKSKRSYLFNLATESARKYQGSQNSLSLQLISGQLTMTPMVEMMQKKMGVMKFRQIMHDQWDFFMKNMNRYLRNFDPVNKILKPNF